MYPKYFNYVKLTVPPQGWFMLVLQGSPFLSSSVSPPPPRHGAKEIAARSIASYQDGCYDTCAGSSVAVAGLLEDIAVCHMLETYMNKYVTVYKLNNKNQRKTYTSVGIHFCLYFFSRIQTFHKSHQAASIPISQHSNMRVWIKIGYLNLIGCSIHLHIQNKQSNLWFHQIL